MLSINDYTGRTMKTSIQPFEMKNLPLIVDVVEPLWCPPVGDKNFKRFNVEYIVRNNIFENDYHFQFVDETSDNEILSAAFFARKNDISSAEEWFSRESTRFPENLKIASQMSKTYLNKMDELTHSLMNDDDIKRIVFREFIKRKIFYVQSSEPDWFNPLFIKLYTRASYRKRMLLECVDTFKWGFK